MNVFHLIGSHRINVTEFARATAVRVDCEELISDPIIMAAAFPEEHYV